MIKLTFLVRSLDCGGSERQLVLLAKALNKKIFDVTLFTFYRGGPLEKELEGGGVRLVSMDKRGRWDVAGFMSRLARHIRLQRPDVIHGYLDISNILALSSKPFLHGPAVVWGARCSDIDLKHYDWLRRSGFWLERRLSRFADLIIVNSDAYRTHLASRGFPAEKMVLINNGIDIDYFRPDAEAGRRVRGEWGIPEGAILVGLVGRLDPQKDYPTFLRAASLLSRELRDVRFVCVGTGAESYRQKLHQLGGQLSLSGKIHWAGLRSDMRAVYNALDINVLSSRNEGFPNAVCEAMACAVPCVVTDAGDSRLIVGDTGFVSAPRDPEALAANLMSCVESDREVLGARARQRIKESWSVERLAERTERAILSLR